VVLVQPAAGGVAIERRFNLARVVIGAFQIQNTITYIQLVVRCLYYASASAAGMSSPQVLALATSIIARLNNVSTGSVSALSGRWLVQQCLAMAQATVRAAESFSPKSSTTGVVFYYRLFFGCYQCHRFSQVLS
jgi:hypothetical protein